MTKRILIVEDEFVVAQDIREELTGLGYVVSGVAFSASEAIQKAAETRPDLVLMDIVLQGDGDGLETASQIHKRFDIPVVYLTAHSDEATLQRAKITRPFGYVIKPFEGRDLLTNIEISLYKHDLEKTLKESARWLAELNIELQARNDELDAFAQTVATAFRAR